VLACGFTALLGLSGYWAKLAALKHCPILIQITLCYSSAQQGILGFGKTVISGLKALCEAEHRKAVWSKHDECLSEASFRRVPN